ncbi:hypothetical protein C1706_12600 [Propioniciclava flava]|uniref:DUF4870 domain-containing protein n=2 Tax=Propioniciclava flava TaxID=2072026 RepID=A0A4Q2ECN9_9ACTN|nr:hypothetical protein C1706_12600 [Propioniciclava flava]
MAPMSAPGFQPPQEPRVTAERPWFGPPSREGGVEAAGAGPFEANTPEPTLVLPPHLFAEAPTPVPGALRQGDSRDPWKGVPLSPSQRFWVPASHWLGLVTTWVGPVAILLTVGERDPRVRAHACASLNFEITVALALLVGAATLPWGVGAVIMGLTGAIWFLARIVAAARAARGRLVRYPGSLRLVR